ncbi:Acb2/Tad1 domain-containing protein [Streptomyces sp. NPDC001984]
MDAADDVIRRFTFHPADTDERRQAHEDIRSACLELALMLHTELPAGAEKQSAMFRLEEVMFWANAAVARQPKESS